MDYKVVPATQKVAVVYLNTSGDFPAWHVALRRLVVGYSMTDALMYSVAENEMESMKQRVEKTAAYLQPKVKAEQEEGERRGALSKQKLKPKRS